MRYLSHRKCHRSGNRTSSSTVHKKALLKSKPTQTAVAQVRRPQLRRRPLLAILRTLGASYVRYRGVSHEKVMLAVGLSPAFWLPKSIRANRAAVRGFIDRNPRWHANRWRKQCPAQESADFCAGRTHRESDRWLHAGPSWHTSHRSIRRHGLARPD